MASFSWRTCRRRQKPSLNGENILLVGLGPAGLAACRSLSKDVQLTIVEPKDFVEYTPSILNGVVDPDSWLNLVVSVEDALAAACDRCGESVKWNWVRGHVAVIRDTSAEVVHRDGRTSQLSFDSAIIATGTSNGLWKAGGPPLIGCGAMSLESSGCTIAGREAQLREERARLELAAAQAKAGGSPRIVVVGGGIVGVELASEIACAFPDLRSCIVLANRGAHLLGNNPPSAARCAQQWFEQNGVKVVTGDAATPFLKEGDVDEYGESSANVIKYMCVGARPTLPKFEPDVALDAKGYVLVDKQLRVLSNAGDTPWTGGRVFACGDCAEIRGLEGKINKTIYPAETMAPTAVHNAQMVLGAQTCDLKSVHAWLDPTVTSLGHNFGVLVLNGYTVLTGWPAAFVKRLIEKTKVDETKGGVAGSIFWKAVPHY